MKNVHTFKIGAFTCTLFRDLIFNYQAVHYFLDIDEKETSTALSAYHQTPSRIPSPFVSLLLEYEDLKIIVDTGVGVSEKPMTFQGHEVDFSGQFMKLLANKGINPKAITHVVLTHFHPDHIGGACDQKGHIQFPNAQFIAHTDEWDFWIESKSETLPPLFDLFIKENINPLAEQDLWLLSKKEVEILPGIQAVHIPGHTPGQLALHIESEGQKLLFISDAWLHPLHIEHLNWRTSYDMYHEEAKQSRIKLLQLAYQENMLVQSFHFDFPGLGKVDRTTDGWKWIAEKS